MHNFCMQQVIYWMPGMAASSKIFERIQLDENLYQSCFLEWELPIENESLRAYAARMCEKIMHPNPILIGVSFGGILVQEMAKVIPTSQVIIISSVKCNQELPPPMQLAKKTKVHKLLPTGIFTNLSVLTKFAFGDYVKQRVKLYEIYLARKEKAYLDWAIDQVVNWDREVPDANVVHIHGDKDEVFPAKYLMPYTQVKGGTHLMILNRFRWFNENLPKILPPPFLPENN